MPQETARLKRLHYWVRKLSAPTEDPLEIRLEKTIHQAASIIADLEVSTGAFSEETPKPEGYDPAYGDNRECGCGKGYAEHFPRNPSGCGGFRDRVFEGYLPKKPDGRINNCLLSCEGVETHPEYGPCQMCLGKCPDKELRALRGLETRTPTETWPASLATTKEMLRLNLAYKPAGICVVGPETSDFSKLLKSVVGRKGAFVELKLLGPGAVTLISEYPELSGYFAIKDLHSKLRLPGDHLVLLMSHGGAEFISQVLVEIARGGWGQWEDLTVVLKVSSLLEKSNILKECPDFVEDLFGPTVVPLCSPSFAEATELFGSNPILEDLRLKTRGDSDMMQKVLSESPSNIETAMISATSLARGKAIRGELFCRPAMQVLAHLYEGDPNPDSSGWTQKLEALGALSCIPMNTLEVKKVGGQLGFVPQELKIAEVYLRAFGVREGGRE